MHTRSGLIKVGLQSDCISDVAALSVASVPSSPIIIITMITAVCSPSLVCRCNLIKSECNVCASKKMPRPEPIFVIRPARAHRIDSRDPAAAAALLDLLKNIN